MSSNRGPVSSMVTGAPVARSTSAMPRRTRGVTAPVVRRPRTSGSRWSQKVNAIEVGPFSDAEYRNSS